MSNTLEWRYPFERATMHGIELFMIPIPGSGLVASSIFFRRGSADELPEEHGLHTFTLDMLLRGTQKHDYDTLHFKLESLGALTGASDGRDSSSLSLRASREEFPEALGLIFEMLQAPAFDPQQLEIERRQVLAGLRVAEDDKFRLTAREYQKRMFAGHGYAHPTEGEAPDVQRITPEACVQWHRQMLRPGCFTLFVAGDFAPEELERWLDRYDLPGKKGETLRSRQMTQPEPVETLTHEMTRDELQQGFIVMGYRTPTLTSPDYPALRLASAVLGEGFTGRIFSKLRDERGLAYACGAALSPYRLACHQLLYIGTQPERVDEALAGLHEQAETLRSGELTQADLDRAREYIIGKYLMGQQSLAQKIAQIAWWEDAAGDANLATQWPEKLKSVTIEQVCEVTRQWWRDPVTVILRPAT